MVAINLNYRNTVILIFNMSESYLIFGNNQEERKKTVINLINKKTGLKSDLKKWKDHPDLLVLSKKKKKKSLGIDQIRASIKYLNEKPFSLKYKFLVIPQAYLLTTQAQNALLKTLEEPPLYADIFLLTKTREDLLETIISRCKLVSIRKEGEYVFKKEDKNSAFKIRNMKMGKRLDWADDFSREDLEVIIQTLEKWILELRSGIIEDNNEVKSYSNIKMVLKILNDLQKTNINKSLALKNLVLHLQ